MGVKVAYAFMFGSRMLECITIKKTMNGERTVDTKLKIIIIVQYECVVTLHAIRRLIEHWPDVGSFTRIVK
jgi:hypothetical protein